MLNTDIYVQFGTIRAQKAQPGSVEETRVIKSFLVPATLILLDGSLTANNLTFTQIHRDSETNTIIETDMITEESKMRWGCD